MRRSKHPGAFILFIMVAAIPLAIFFGIRGIVRWFQRRAQMPTTKPVLAESPIASVGSGKNYVEVFNEVEEEAISMLTCRQLGFTKREARGLVGMVVSLNPNATAEEIVVLALREHGRRK